MGKQVSFAPTMKATNSSEKVVGVGAESEMRREDVRWFDLKENDLTASDPRTRKDDQDGWKSTSVDGKKTR